MISKLPEWTADLTELYRLTDAVAIGIAMLALAIAASIPTIFITNYTR